MHVEGRERKCRLVAGVEWKENGFSACYPVSVPLALKWEEELFVQGSSHTAWLCFSSVMKQTRGLCAAHQSSDSRTSLNRSCLCFQRKARFDYVKECLTVLSNVVLGVEKSVTSCYMGLFCANTTGNSRVLLCVLIPETQ